MVVADAFRALKPRICYTRHCSLRLGGLAAAEAGEEVVVSIAGQSHDAKADAKGDWSVKLKPLKAGGPHMLSIKGANTIELKNVLVGDVWIGSGQSNMAGGVRGYTKNDEVLAELAAGT